MKKNHSCIKTVTDFHRVSLKSDANECRASGSDQKSFHRMPKLKKVFVKIKRSNIYKENI